MNIFFLAWNITIAAQAHVDSHVRKMILESLQLLSLTWKYYCPEFTSEHLYLVNSRYVNHPSAIWTRQSPANYLWLSQLAIALCQEFEYRFNKKHAAEPRAQWMANHIPANLLKLKHKLTLPGLAMPEHFKHDYLTSNYESNFVQYWTTMIHLGEREPVTTTIFSYRYYYLRGKLHLLKYTRRPPPLWVQPMLNLTSVEVQLRKAGWTLYYYHQPLVNLTAEIKAFCSVNKHFTRETALQLIWLIRQARSFSMVEVREVARQYAIKARSKDDLLRALVLHSSTTASTTSSTTASLAMSRLSPIIQSLCILLN